jgi:predicted ribosome quality control (RQC) complex YloA/Tae2 family protein
MSLALTHTELAWLFEEWQSLLEEAAIQKVYEASDRQYILQIRRPGETLLLLLDTDPGSARVHLIDKDERPKSDGHPSAFTMLMRKWIQGMVTRSISLDEQDRVIVIRGDRISPDWEPPEDHSEEGGDVRPPRVDVALVIELLGQTTNLFVLGPKDEVLGFEFQDQIAARSLKRAARWEMPPPPPDIPPSNRFEGEEVANEEIAYPRSAFVSQWFNQKLVLETRDDLVRDLTTRLKQQHKRTRRLVKNIEGDLERATEAQQWRQWGELLQSAYGKIARGASLARVPNYYEEGMPEIEIPLDPARSLQENIDHYFRQYRRLDGAIDQIETRLLEVMERSQALEEAREALRTFEGTLEELRAWRDDLVASGTLEKDRPGANQRHGKRGGKRVPYRAFSSRRGKTILVGRNASSNDELSTHVARGRDVWLHARDWAGSHVVLRMDRDENPTQDDLWDAALLAAHFSKGREDTLIDVTYTRAKHVRKPKGYPPGLVTVAGGSTLGVSIDKERLAALLADETPT